MAFLFPSGSPRETFERPGHIKVCRHLRVVFSSGKLLPVVSGASDGAGGACEGGFPMQRSDPANYYMRSLRVSASAVVGVCCRSHFSSSFLLFFLFNMEASKEKLKKRRRSKRNPKKQTRHFPASGPRVNSAYSTPPPEHDDSRMCLCRDHSKRNRQICSTAEASKFRSTRLVYVLPNLVDTSATRPTLCK